MIDVGRYVFLWASRIGYSLSPNPDIICNFISFDDISRAEVVDAESKDWRTKCDFVVQVSETYNSEISIDRGEEESDREKRSKEQLLHSSPSTGFG